MEWETTDVSNVGYLISPPSIRKFGFSMLLDRLLHIQPFPEFSVCNKPEKDIILLHSSTIPICGPLENSYILIEWVMTLSWEEGWAFSKLWSPRSNPQGWMPSGDLIHIAPQGIKWGFISLKMAVCFSLIKMCFPFILLTVLSSSVPYERDSRFGCPLSSSFMLFWTSY